MKTDRSPNVRYLSPGEEKGLRQALDAREQEMIRKRDSANDWRRERSYDTLPDLKEQPFVDQIKPLVLISLKTGLRRGEMFALRWEDVDLTTRLLTVRGSHAKSSQTRHVPLNNEAWRLLNDWQKRQAGKNHDLVFSGATGKGLTNIQRSWTSIRKAADLRNFRWHDLRNSFASHLVQRGVALNTVRELLGHADIQMTLRYAHLAPDQRTKAVALLDPPKTWTAAANDQQRPQLALNLGGD